jgi:DNA-binding transcriptional MerR regulator
MLLAIFSSGQAQAFAGVTQRQLEYWDKTGLISPSVQVGTGKGSRRLYSQLDLVQLRVAKSLLDAGMSLQAVRKSVRFLDQQLPKIDFPLSELLLVSDGRSIYAYRESSVALDTVRRPGQTTFLIPVGDMYRAMPVNGTDGAVHLGSESGT